METTVGSDDKLCRKCGQPLSEFLIRADADWHITCFPEPEWQAWIGRLQNDPV